MGKRTGRIHDGFKPVKAEDVTDHALLPRRFDRLSTDVHELIDEIRHNLVPEVTKNTTALQDLRSEVSDAIAQIHALAGRVDKLEVTDKDLAGELAAAAAKLTTRVDELETKVDALAKRPTRKKPASKRRPRRR